MPKEKKEQAPIPTLVDNSLHLVTAELQAARSAIKNLKAKEEELVDEIKAKVGDVEDGKVNVIRDDWDFGYQVQMVAGANSSIKREKLLERGVSPEVIDYATSRTTYTSIRIKETQED